VIEAGMLVPRGAVAPPPPATVEDLDRVHEEMAKSDLLRLSNRAYGPDRPTELHARGKTTWWTLGRFVAGLRLRPAQV
jgi:hypothetical protein